MLRLNPDDNQGIRYVLMTTLLVMGEDAELTKLFKLYPDEGAGVWRYGRALAAFRAEGDSKLARKLLAEATRANRYVPAYLLGEKRLPKELPEMMGWGDDNEAVICASEQLEAWRGTPGALSWMERSVRR